MRGAAWMSLLRVIPPEQHGKLMMVSSSGNEINIQNIYRMEEDYMVIRGRLSGTTDAAAVIFVPYDQIDYLGFREEVKEDALQAMFSGPGYTPAAAERKKEVAAEAEAEPRPSPEAAAAALAPLQPAAQAPLQPLAPTPTPTPRPPTPSPLPTAAPSLSPVLPGKAALLERLRRSRLGQESAKPADK